MVETRASRGGRGGRSPHGRGRRGGRTTPVGPETRISAPEADGTEDRVEASRGRGRPHIRASSTESEIRGPAPDGTGIGDGAPVQADVGVLGGGTVPVQQPIPVDSDRLQEIVRRLVREAVVAARATLAPDPVASPVPAPPVAPVPVAEVAEERYGDRIPSVGQSRPLLFHGGRDGDVERWLRGIEGVFDTLAAPDDVRCRLATGLLREDALRSWMIRQGERPTWSYADFKGAMLRDFSPPGVQISREATFLRGAYTRSISIPEVIHQFQRELFYCSHPCPTDTSRIWILLRRLSPEVLRHTSGLGDVTFDQVVEVVLRYDQQGMLSAPGYPSSSRQSGKRPREITCYGCHEEGHYQVSCPRSHMECHSCHGLGHRARFCPRRGRDTAIPHPPRVLSLRDVEDDHPVPPFTGTIPIPG